MMIGFLHHACATYEIIFLNDSIAKQYSVLHHITLTQHNLKSFGVQDVDTHALFWAGAVNMVIKGDLSIQSLYLVSFFNMTALHAQSPEQEIGILTAASDGQQQFPISVIKVGGLTCKVSTLPLSLV